jgi:homopolymeric O-antigen transport system permease protein
VTQTDLEVREAATARPRTVSATERSVPVVVIRPAARWPHLDVRELWHFRELLGTLVWRDVKVRYKQTFVGIAWALLVPVFTAIVYVVVFGKFAKFPAGGLPYPILVFTGILPMQYFTSSLTGSSTSLVQNANLVTKVYFPRVLLPLAAVCVPVVDFLFGWVVLVGLMARYDSWPGAEIVLAPAFMALAFITALGAGLLLSAVNVRYRDVPYAIPVFLQVLPLLSGVPYALSDIPEKWQWLLSFNPMTGVISGWRWAVVDGSPPVLGQLAVSVSVGVLIFLAGLAYFRRTEPRFADTM